MDIDIKQLPKEIKPTFTEKVALAAKIYNFAFSLAIAVVILPLTHFLPGSGWFLFLIRILIVASVIYTVNKYLEDIRKSYYTRAKEFIVLRASVNNNK